MEATWRWSLVTAFAPITWGTTYWVTRHLLPVDHPLWGAVLRALPAGLVLLVVARRLPRCSWWWRSAVLGTLTMGAFFALVYVAAQLLPTSVAATVMATSPVVMILVAWLLLAQRPRLLALAGAALGLVGVALMLLTGGADIDPLGVLASVAAMTMSSVGFVLATRWSEGVDVVSSTAWQLVAGGLVLLPFAVAVEGNPPTLDGPAVLGFAYVSLVSTALAYLAWYAGLRHLPAGTVGLVGLLNPVTGVLLGTVVAAERLTVQQALGIVVVLAGVLLGQPAVERATRRWWTRPRAVSPRTAAARRPRPAAGAPAPASCGRTAAEPTHGARSPAGSSAEGGSEPTSSSCSCLHDRPGADALR
ncbi:EamA family transporter [Cellulomonas soli]|uniref:ABC transporter permease n=1 Tax=Cellulomonas soli TaxID=931535 RepID=A0A512PHC4_9CELL|nr:EamA family transporter [Cellulomonas soli]NYI60798.1 putative blue pigment (indigoidine) exporter [Cellulomonas soli]GEP70618.1 ABC transporter permease [Cellulomonas soli]